MSIKFKLPDEKKRESARRRGITKRYSINSKLYEIKRILEIENWILDYPIDKGEWHKYYIKTSDLMNFIKELKAKIHNN